MPASVPVAIALGSNLGDRQSHIAWAISQLRRIISPLRASSVRETEPFDVPDEQPRYLNAVVVGETELSAVDLLEELRFLETERGRTRPSLRAARTLDLDLILYGDRVINTSELTVPHPRFRDRLFVLQPLNEIAPDMTDPVTGRTVRQLLNNLQPATNNQQSL